MMIETIFVLSIFNTLFNLVFLIAFFLIYHNIDYMSYICRRDLNSICNKIYEEDIDLD